MKSKNWSVGAYKPAGENLPVLVPLLFKKFIGPVARKGEESYDLLKRVCGGKPEWLFGTKEQEL